MNILLNNVMNILMSSIMNMNVNIPEHVMNNVMNMQVGNVVGARKVRSEDIHNQAEVFKGWAKSHNRYAKEPIEWEEPVLLDLTEECSGKQTTRSTKLGSDGGSRPVKTKRNLSESSSKSPKKRVRSIKFCTKSQKMTRVSLYDDEGGRHNL